MATIPERPRSATPTDPRSPSAVRWDAPDDVRRWLAALQDQIDDALAAGEDATRRPRRRVLSRTEARRKLKAAQIALVALLDAAVRGLVREGANVTP